MIERTGITEAYNVLNKHFSKIELDGLYREKRFDNSETDTIAKHKYNGELLRKKSYSIKVEEEAKKLRDAADAFEKLAQQEDQYR